MNKHRILVSVEQPNKWNSLTQEDRQRMTVSELIAVMGPLHVNHPQFKARPRSLLPIPNLAGVQPMISHVDRRLFPWLKFKITWAIAWALR